MAKLGACHFPDCSLIRLMVGYSSTPEEALGQIAVSYMFFQDLKVKLQFPRSSRSDISTRKHVVTFKIVDSWSCYMKSVNFFQIEKTYMDLYWILCVLQDTRTDNSKIMSTIASLTLQIICLGCHQEFGSQVTFVVNSPVLD